jgi:hypothetical protein
MISTQPATWTTRQWVALVGVLVLIIVILLLAWPRQAAGPDHVTIRVVKWANCAVDYDGPAALSSEDSQSLLGID